jgi:hypothetical protein
MICLQRRHHDEITIIEVHANRKETRTEQRVGKFIDGAIAVL